MPRLNHYLQESAIAGVAVLVALLIMLLLNPWIPMSGTPFLMFFGAVMFSAWHKGMLAGLVATGLSVLLSRYFFIEPLYSLALDAADVVRLVLFGVEGIFITVLCHELRATNRKLNRSVKALSNSEERYRYLAELIPQLAWTANAEGALLDVNQRWSDFTGLTLAQAKTGGWQAVIHPDDVPILSRHWATAQQERTHYQAEGRMRRADGVYRWHLHQAMPQKDSQGNIVKWFGTATDIEDQKQLEQQRDRMLQQEQAAREAAEKANRMKDNFLAVLSHELRSPLNPILGWAKLLQTRKFDQPALQKALQTIERNASLQAQLIEDLLDVSRILQAKLSLNMLPVNLIPSIEAAIETVRLAVEAKRIQLKTNLDPNVGKVLGDPVRLQQIIWNLLSNAVKFTPEGGRVEVCLERVGGDGGDGGDAHSSPPSPCSPPSSSSPSPPLYAQIKVIDTGKGIDPSFLPYLFDYFRQADDTTTRKFGGLGLGLAIARHLVEGHGGSIWAESEGEGHGATFIVRLPLLAKASSAHPSISVQTEPNLSAHRVQPPTVSAPLSGVYILIVDDELDSRELLTFGLEQAGAIVTAVSSACEGLDLLAKNRSNVVLSDIGMPEMDGYTFIRQIRGWEKAQGEPPIPAIALTAYAGEVGQRQALASGFQRHVSKPMELDQLIDIILDLIKP